MESFTFRTTGPTLLVLTLLRRCTSRMKCVGAIVGKALEPVAEGKRIIKVLVMLR